MYQVDFQLVSTSTTTTTTTTKSLLIKSKAKPNLNSIQNIAANLLYSSKKQKNISVKWELSFVSSDKKETHTQKRCITQN